MAATNYLDLPTGVHLDVLLSFGDRIHAVCLDGRNCTIANAIHRQRKALGIVTLERRGVGRCFVDLTLDPKVHPWAVAGQVYRGWLPAGSAATAAELDSWHNKPAAHRKFQGVMKAMAAAAAQGQATTWGVITITAPPPSRRKGYRAGHPGKTRGAGTGRKGVLPARHYAA